MSGQQASRDELSVLIEAAKRAAERIRRDGWPEAQFYWPPVGKTSRLGIAYGIDGKIVGLPQVFVWIKGGGLWLGEDGMFYRMVVASGSQFCRLTPHMIEEEYPSVERIAEVIRRLDALRR